MKNKLVLVALAVVVIWAIGSTRSAAAQPQSVVVTSPGSDTAFDEASEYNTLVWNAPLNMSNPLDIRQTDTPGNGILNGFNVFSCAAGLWCATVATDSPNLFFLDAGYPGALHVGRDGNLRPINANFYTQLTFRMYLDQVPAGSVGWQAMWTNGTIADFGVDSTSGQTAFYPLEQGWNIYTIDLSSPPLRGLAWSGNLTGLRLNIGAHNMTGRTVEFDWARLSTQNGDNQPITWSSNGESGNVGLSLISSNGASTPFRDFVVVGNCPNCTGYLQSIPVSAGSHLFRGSLPPDNWRVNVQVLNSSASDTSNGRWLIQPAPTLSFVKPSYTTGADYATVVKGDPWDMTDDSDVPGGVINAIHHTFSGGVLSAQNTNTDAHILMEQDPLPSQFYIDTSRFRYVTFSLKVDGTTDISNGYIARLFWFTHSNQLCGESNDIPLHSDWNTVSLDLWDNSILDDQAAATGCNHGWQANATRDQFRLDPDEIPQPTYFHYGQVWLTAMDTASASGAFPIEYTLGVPGDGVTFYYNTSRSTDGRRPARGTNQVAAAPGAFAFNVYLPMVFKQFVVNNPPPGTQTFVWSLGGVRPNTYYLSADVSDGNKTVTWFSDTPVVVTP